MARPTSPRLARSSAGACLPAVLVAVLLAACNGSESSPTGTSSSTSSSSSSGASGSAGRCLVSDREVPSCGTLWGVAVKPPTPARLQEVESAVGRSFDFVYRYHDVTSPIPDRSERAAIAAGKTLHVSIAARSFRGGGTVTWADVAQGKFDTTLRAQAKGIAGIGKPVFVTFEQEANQKAKVSRGSGADFKAAWRHLHQIYQQEGATNAVWVWVMTGAAGNLDRAGQLWPGNDVVDWISWNVYNQSGCTTGHIDPAKYVSFEAKLKIFYDWVKSRGPGLGIDTSKPMMISETGSAQYPGDPARTAGWYAAIPSVLQRYPQIKAVGLWDSVDGPCSYRFDGTPAIAGGVASAGKQAWVNVRGTGAGASSSTPSSSSP